ncbi:putative monooxygenase p33MONOX isoform X1 [Denticeps clupeoides]|uniref:Putative monooxygenase p33MONOX n=1 Tax=Denticeps clupeoides TaxID=299321 RepID=A0AAY4CU62_9TELE|nr:putative monooxygenase p33MONOX isoform X1 [Denticeps clupeoides]
MQTCEETGRGHNIPEKSPKQLCGMSSPGVIRRHFFSYDDAFDVAPHSPPNDFTDCVTWKNPVIPEHTFRHLEESHTSDVIVTRSPAVKTKSSSMMTSLMIKLAQDNRQRTESHQDGPGRRRGQTVAKLKMPSGDFKGDNVSTSAQSTPSCTPSVTPNVSPQPSPAICRRSQLSPVPVQPNNREMGGNEGAGGDRWTFFASTRSVVQNSTSDPGSKSSSSGPFTLQSYFGVQKSSTLEGMKTQVSLTVEDPINQAHITDAGDGKVVQRPHKLKPRDMNILTPSGF